jgi:RNA-directed DNA polymerase
MAGQQTASQQTAPPDDFDPASTIVTRVNEVNMVFTATDKHGHFVKDLKKEDVQILDDTDSKYAKLDARQYNGSAYGMVPAHRVNRYGEQGSEIRRRWRRGSCTNRRSGRRRAGAWPSRNEGRWSVPVRTAARPRRVATSQRTEFFCGYTPAVSPTALKSMRATIRSLHIPRQTTGTLAEIARQINPLLRGWIGYYGRFSRSALYSLVNYVNQKLKAWIMRKYKRFRFHKTRASLFLRKLARDNAELFVHWQSFGTTTFT